MSSLQVGQQSEIVFSNPIKKFKIKQYRADSLISKFSYMLIRPPRFLYDEKLLGLDRKLGSRFKMQKRLIPFQLTLYTVKNMEYVILYLHGNSSSRLEGKIHLSNLPEGVGLACFDFNGCGLRNQQFITLGKKQAAQVDTAARYLKNIGYKVVGWGRSMGAVSLLLSQQCDIMVADSPFNSLGDLCKTSSSKFLPVYCCCLFYCFYPCVFQCIRSDVQQKSGMDIKQMEIGKLIKQNPRNRQRSLIIITGKNDLMIPYQHGKIVYENFPGRKQYILFDGCHNSDRPTPVNNQIFNFISQQLEIMKKQPSCQNYQQLKMHNRQQSDQTQTTTKQQNGIQLGIIQRQTSSVQLLSNVPSGTKLANESKNDKPIENSENAQQDQGSMIDSIQKDDKKRESILTQTNVEQKQKIDENDGEKQIAQKQGKNNSIKIFPKNKLAQLDQC